MWIPALCSTSCRIALCRSPSSPCPRIRTWALPADAPVLLPTDCAVAALKPCVIYPCAVGRSWIHIVCGLSSRVSGVSADQEHHRVRILRRLSGAGHPTAASGFQLQRGDIGARLVLLIRGRNRICNFPVCARLQHLALLLLAACPPARRPYCCSTRHDHTRGKVNCP